MPINVPKAPEQLGRGLLDKLAGVEYIPNKFLRRVFSPEQVSIDEFPEMIEIGGKFGLDIRLIHQYFRDWTFYNHFAGIERSKLRLEPGDDQADRESRFFSRIHRNISGQLEIGAIGIIGPHDISWEIQDGEDINPSDDSKPIGLAENRGYLQLKGKYDRLHISGHSHPSNTIISVPDLAIARGNNMQKAELVFTPDLFFLAIKSREVYTSSNLKTDWLMNQDNATYKKQNDEIWQVLKNKHNLRRFCGRRYVHTDDLFQIYPEEANDEGISLINTVLVEQLSQKMDFPIYWSPKSQRSLTLKRFHSYLDIFQEFEQ